jgi:hypothetical protein
LWHDERGEAYSLALILLTTIVALGAIVGLVTLRDQLVQEFGDVGVALENINQSFTSACGTFTDTGPFPTDPAGAPPGDLDLGISP